MSEILTLAEGRDAALGLAVGAARAGKLIVMPTDTVYGLAADAFTPGATQKVFELKKRPRSLPLPVLVSRPRQAWALASSVPDGATELAAAFWPGPLTIILRQSPDAVWDLGESDGSIALRIPDHDDALDLLEMTGPLAVTSANLSGEPTPQTVEEIAERLGDAVAVYLDGGPAKGEVGSTIVDLSRDRARVLREGPIPADQVKRVLAGGRPDES